VVADELDALILFIDMERGTGASPYRLLACAPNPTRAVVLKRTG